MPSIHRYFLIASVALAGACAGGAGGSSGPGFSRDTVTKEQLLETGRQDLRSALQNLRPTWLRARGTTSINQPSEVLVYVNDAQYGGVDALASMPVDIVVDVRYISASDAATRYGTPAGTSGVIAVRTGG